MSDLILVNDDLVQFNQAFGLAMVVVRPGRLSGSGPGTLNGKSICVDGDQNQVSVPGCVYMTAVYSIPGTGTLKIDSLSANQIATKTRSGAKPALLKGVSFIAKFEVQSPAQQPPPGPGSPIPDSTLQYPGSGSFITANQTIRGT